MERIILYRHIFSKVHSLNRCCQRNLSIVKYLTFCLICGTNWWERNHKSILRWVVRFKEIWSYHVYKNFMRALCVIFRTRKHFMHLHGIQNVVHHEYEMAYLTSKIWSFIVTCMLGSERSKKRIFNQQFLSWKLIKKFFENWWLVNNISRIQFPHKYVWRHRNITTKNLFQLPYPDDNNPAELEILAAIVCSKLLLIPSLTL